VLLWWSSGLGEEQHFEEPAIEAPAPTPEPGFDAPVAGSPPAYRPDGYCTPDICCDCPDDPMFRFRGGLSYYDHPRIDSKIGATYGLDGLLPMTEIAGGYAAAKANHVSGGSQYYTSLGLYKMADACDESAWGRVGGAIFYDYFTDSRAGDIDLTMCRLYIGTAISETWSVGLRHIEPGDDDRGSAFFGGGGTANFYISESDAVYASGYVGDSLLTLAIGYRERPNTAFLEAALRRPLAANFYGFVDTHYEERGDWAAITGFEFRFGPGGSGCHSCCRTPWDDPTIAESFNWGEAKTFGSAVDVNNKSDGPDEYELR
jgi:hypothetical protein